MRRLIITLISIFVFFACEKETPFPKSAEAQQTIHFPSDADMALSTSDICTLIDEVIAQVNQLKADGEIGHGPAQSILSKLHSIKKKIEQGKTSVALSKLESLKTHLLELAAGGKVAEEIIEELLAEIEDIQCSLEGNCFPYATVVLPGGKTWLAENLNEAVDGAECFDLDPDNCVTYGRLYTWDEAKIACESLGDGWRLPTKEEWETIIAIYDGNDEMMDMNTTAYRELIDGGTSGLNLQLGGIYYTSYGGLGDFGHYWSGSENGSEAAWQFLLDNYNERIGSGGYFKSTALSCRCIKE